MYELFILGILIEGPMHGYLLHQVINKAIGPVRQMGWSALYPLLRRLEIDGLVTQEEPEGSEEGGRPRKVYRITEAGRARFHRLMAEPASHDGDHPDLFTTKLCNFCHVDVETQRAILRQYDDFLRFQLRHLHAQQERHLHAYAEGRPIVGEARLASILATIDHRLHVLQADLDWVRREIVARQDAIPAHPDPRPRA